MRGEEELAELGVHDELIADGAGLDVLQWSLVASVHLNSMMNRGWTGIS
jgi:hypothetical protein